MLPAAEATWTASGALSGWPLVPLEADMMQSHSREDMSKSSAPSKAIEISVESADCKYPEKGFRNTQPLFRYGPHRSSASSHLVYVASLRRTAFHERRFRL